MVVQAVMRAWQEGLGGPLPPGRIHPSEDGRTDHRPGDRRTRPEQADRDVLTADEHGEDPQGLLVNRNDIVPRRRGAALVSDADDSFWSSHLFWKGIVVGAALVLLAKTVMAVYAPSVVEWYMH